MNQTQRKIKICCFCERWESGGIESFLNNLLQHFDLQEFQVDIVTSCLCNSIFTEPLQNLGIRFFELSGSQKKLLKNHKMFSVLLQQEKYDVVQINIFHGISLYYGLLAKRAKIPMRIIHSHNNGLRKSAMKSVKFLLHTVAKEIYTKTATDLWACSKSAAEFLFSKHCLKIKGFQFVPNGIDVRRFQFNPQIRKSVRKELGIDEKFVLGNIGRLCYQKNQLFLLDVFSEIHKQKKESCLLLVGEGETLDVLKQKSKNLNIEDNIIFYGTTKYPEKLLWAMDVFVFPSKFEGFGIAAIEAQATGLPTIVSKNIPEEAEVTDLFERVPDFEIYNWINKIMENERVKKRETYNTKVKVGGFDIIDVSSILMKTIQKRIKGDYF